MTWGSNQKSHRDADSWGFLLFLSGRVLYFCPSSVSPFTFDHLDVRRGAKFVAGVGFIGTYFMGRTKRWAFPVANSLATPWKKKLPRGTAQEVFRFKGVRLSKKNDSVENSQKQHHREGGENRHLKRGSGMALNRRFAPGQR